jgi:hypothetical protein
VLDGIVRISALLCLVAAVDGQPLVGLSRVDVIEVIAVLAAACLVPRGQAAVAVLIALFAVSVLLITDSGVQALGTPDERRIGLALCGLILLASRATAAALWGSLEAFEQPRLRRQATWVVGFSAAVLGSFVALKLTGGLYALQKLAGDAAAEPSPAQPLVSGEAAWCLLLVLGAVLTTFALGVPGAWRSIVIGGADVRCPVTELLLVMSCTAFAVSVFAFGSAVANVAALASALIGAGIWAACGYLCGERGTCALRLALGASLGVGLIGLLVVAHVDGAFVLATGPAGPLRSIAGSGRFWTEAEPDRVRREAGVLG